MSLQCHLLTNVGWYFVIFTGLLYLSKESIAKAISQISLSILMMD